MSRREFWSRGVPFIWGTGSMVVLCLLLLAGMVGLIVVKGLEHFWPQDLIRISTDSGDQYLAQVMAHEQGHDLDTGPRTKYKIGGRDVYGLDFRWIDDAHLAGHSRPLDAVALERSTHGDLFGFLAAVQDETGPAAGSAQDLWSSLQTMRHTAERTADDIQNLEQQIAEHYRPLTERERRLSAARRAQQQGGRETAARLKRLESDIEETRLRTEALVKPLHDRIAELRELDLRRTARIRLADDRDVEVRLSEVVRAWQPNRMSWIQRAGHFTAGAWTFISAWPREANTGGGIFPALFGTVLMVLLMTLAVVPLGVVAALYLHEYARDNWFVRAVRLAVNNLAGVPSIVFGVFGLGFFIYFVGAGIDRAFFSEYLPSPTFGTGGILWASLTLALLTVPVVIVATEEGLAAVPRSYREGALALGATRFQTIRKIVIPHAMPGILTGVILAVSRGAGEVAPLMLTGVIPLVSDFPVDGAFPFLHLERKFMHLGFHIYDVGFQSPNVEAVKPLVYSTTLVLIALVVLLNAVAIIMRNRLRARARGASV